MMMTVSSTATTTGLPFALLFPQALRRRWISHFQSSSSSSLQHLDEVERTVTNVLKKYNVSSNSNNKIHKFSTLTLEQRNTFLSSLPANSERECWSIAQHLNERLTGMRKQGTCRRCWLHPEHCICKQLEQDDLPTVSSSLPDSVNRIFLLMHHKEIGISVDTAKLILMAFPQQTRLVVAGLPASYQTSMKDLQQDALRKSSTFILFPDAQRAKTWKEWNVLDRQQQQQHHHQQQQHHNSKPEKMDIVLLDGTWEQARRMYRRYLLSAEPVDPNDEDGAIREIPARRVHLSNESLASLLARESSHKNNPSTTISSTSTTSRPLLLVGQQLRRHPEPVRQIATVHALQLLLQDMLATEEEMGGADDHAVVAARNNKLASLQQRLEHYQTLANAAARMQCHI